MKSTSVRCALWLVFTGLLAAAAMAARQATVSDDKAKALLESKCTSCHGLDQVETAAKRDKAGWKAVVDSMRSKGADLKDDEAATVVDYLAKTYGADADAEMKQLVETSCGSCHGLDVVMLGQKTKEEWAEVVEEMISYGANLKAAQISDVADYLTKHYGPAKK